MGNKSDLFSFLRWDQRAILTPWWDYADYELKIGLIVLNSISDSNVNQMIILLSQAGVVFQNWGLFCNKFIYKRLNILINIKVVKEIKYLTTVMSQFNLEAYHCMIITRLVSLFKHLIKWQCPNPPPPFDYNRNFRQAFNYENQTWVFLRWLKTSGKIVTSSHLVPILEVSVMHWSSVSIYPHSGFMYKVIVCLITE